MEIKKQKKRISKGLKRKQMRGGNWELIKEILGNIGKNIDTTTENWREKIENARLELSNLLDEGAKTLLESFYSKINEFEKDNKAFLEAKENKNEKTDYENWVSFINTFIIYKCENDKCKVKEHIEETEDKVLTKDDGLTEDEAKRIASDFMDKIRIYVNNNTNKRTFFAKDDCEGQSAEKCQAQQSSQGEQKELNVIVEFDNVFKKILEIVKKYIGEGKISTNGRTAQFKTMISLLRALPNIDKNLEALLDKNITNLEERYTAILGLIHYQCSGYGTSFICGAAAGALGEDISALYEKLKNNSKKPVINDNILLEFVIDVVPIMILKLININEFLEAFNELEVIEKYLISQGKTKAPPKGGKKSSGTVRKEILGKLMKIYKIPNDKKEYVRHKGHLITIKQFKEEAKAANHAKPRKPLAVKKVVLGKERCIYKVQGSNKEHIKYKGALIPVADYKKLMGAQ